MWLVSEEEASILFFVNTVCLCVCLCLEIYLVGWKLPYFQKSFFTREEPALTWPEMGNLEDSSADFRQLLNHSAQLLGRFVIYWIVSCRLSAVRESLSFPAQSVFNIFHTNPESGFVFMKRFWREPDWPFSDGHSLDLLPLLSEHILKWMELISCQVV